MTYRAMLAGVSQGLWELFVVVSGPSWPAHRFAGPSIPTHAERADALTGLGFEPVDADAEWDWLELSSPDVVPVRLGAQLIVRPLGNGGAS
ncbi:DUF6303 family protein [Streptomyces sp. bgisy060]|uniref:DUF6303 family protein n=1 Tax=Streptomyces sp. bgisy060 TaxID=3413775 RepID=UPI003EBBBCFA